MTKKSVPTRMADISKKKATKRRAVAVASVKMNSDTFKRVMARNVKKGDVFEVARVAGIMGAKKTHSLIPLCHPLPIEEVVIDYKNNGKDTIKIYGEIQTTAKTGVEMEAIVAVATSAITIYDMLKPYDKRIAISDIHLIEKSGGKSGNFKTGG